ncbi:hypothetical protein QQS21_010758 [Conoideocrella luteorostrata]|uniref:DNA (cytosine-5-)-methyltransferase n=1 Tax=Conoideocrella luteorostrata TaxID=1105319 RepID=A0AAJ0FUC5_9HYPO|nr:hypothetical protein QQS21_010758 [Conoideocrella luteorostrata]
MRGSTEPNQSPCKPQTTVNIPNLQLTSPRSCFEPYTSNAPQKSEFEALQSLLQALKSDPSLADAQQDYVEISLDDFAIYCDTKLYPCEMRCLHQLCTKRGFDGFFFDGILSVGALKIFVKRVPFRTVPIGNYRCLSSHTTRGQIWLHSDLCRGNAIHYKLGSPATEYRRFFGPFLWVADLSKHFVDFLVIMAKDQIRVRLYHFESIFKQRLIQIHGDMPVFMAWLCQHPSDDFRTSIVANVAFLYKETIGVLGETDAYFHSIWAEIWDFTMYPEQQQQCTTTSKTSVAESPTIVTDYIYGLFSHLAFGKKLQAMPMSHECETLRARVITDNHLEHATIPRLNLPTADITTMQGRYLEHIRVGDTISTRRDDASSRSPWKREVSNGFYDVDRWFGRVQKVYVSEQGRKFEVLWYYRPVDTLCGLMKYPWDNELFLSDHCSCSEKHKIQDDEVLGIHEVEFGGNSTTSSEFFCRQVYLNQERKWVALQDHNTCCSHNTTLFLTRLTEENEYQVGDTLLLQVSPGGTRSEPCELISDGAMFQFRRFFRRKDVDPTVPTAPVNELVYSNRLVKCAASRIFGRCHIRFFKHDVKIPTPYSRDRVGCFFFITHEETVDSNNSFKYIPLRVFPKSMKQGFDPTLHIPTLQGLDLFCGGGNFGRGLEEGGAVRMNWINDYETVPIHTYMANCRHPELVSPFLGSIDELHKLVINGQFSKSVPTIGKVDFVSGGSPCPGFSNLTNDKTTEQQRKNQSLVAAFASSVDLYRPKYGVLENVPGIICNQANRAQDVFSQLLCAIVGMGYQAELYLLDASSCGAAQLRSRVFLMFAAPGYRLPTRPGQTHSYPPDTAKKSLGKISTGQAIVERAISTATPFTFISASQATSGLPRIYDSQPDTCIAFPDHRLSTGFTRAVRRRISLIPKHPWGMNFLEASKNMTAAEQSIFLSEPRKQTAVSKAAALIRKNSSAWGRICPDRLMETVLTTQSPGDHKNGRHLHWDEDRPISIMEARRAQGFRDEEVILGTVAQQMKIVGNSVARPVALTLGLAIREAWEQSCWGGMEHHIIKGTLPLRGEHACIGGRSGDSGSSATEHIPTSTPPRTSLVDTTTTFASYSADAASPRVVLKKRRSGLSRLNVMLVDEPNKRP